jgi:hypothetical protein
MAYLKRPGPQPAERFIVNQTQPTEVILGAELQRAITMSDTNSTDRRLPHGLIAYGPNANCTLEICEVEWAILGYQPAFSASGAFIAFFAIAMLIHIALGIKWKTWTFMTLMVIGCIDEIIGYVGRIMLNTNPFHFGAFMMEISKSLQDSQLLYTKVINRMYLVCITTAPVFFCAAIYITLAQT